MQTTIPFIDIQSVSPSPRTWISGASFYHKGTIGYGGYLGIMIKSYLTFRNPNHLTDLVKFGMEVVLEGRFWRGSSTQYPPLGLGCLKGCGGLWSLSHVFWQKLFKTKVAVRH